MKLKSKNLSTLLKALSSSLLTLLGFSSCSDNEVMYGMPFGYFEVKGAVTDDNGKPVSDAEIRVALPSVPSGIESLGSTRTEDDGTYDIRESAYPSKLKIVCIPSQSELLPDSVIVDLKYKGGDKEWNKGHAEKTVNFQLKGSN